MSHRLEGKVSVVTGAGRGIGEAIARALASEGANVVVADVSGREEDVAASIGDAAVAINVDVTSSDSVAAMIGSAVDRFGRLDVLCNNAGIDGPILPTADLMVAGIVAAPYCLATSEEDALWVAQAWSHFLLMISSILAAPSLAAFSGETFSRTTRPTTSAITFSPSNSPA